MKVLFVVASLLAVVVGAANLRIDKGAEEMQKQLDDVARIGSVMVDGDVCQRVVTPRAKEFLFATDPRDQFLAGDNYDVDDAAFNSVKKTLIRMSAFSFFPLRREFVDANRWASRQNATGHTQQKRNEPILELGRALRRNDSADGDCIEKRGTRRGRRQARLDIRPRAGS